MKKINFVFLPSLNYWLVQKQIFSLIQKHLTSESFSQGPYRDGAINFSLFVNQKAEVLMSHGAADKNYHFRTIGENRELFANNLAPRMHILVPGQFLVDRIVESHQLNFDKSQVHSVGWPRLDLLGRPDQGLKAREWLSRFRSKPLTSHKSVLWAPTHDFVKVNGSNTSISSYPSFLPYAKRLAKICQIGTSLHPRNRPIWNKWPTGNVLGQSEVVIADFGTTVWEAYALGKTVIFPTFLTGKYMDEFNVGSAEWHLYSKRLGLHPNSFDEMVDMIREAPPSDDATRAFVEAYMDSSKFLISGKTIADLLMQFAADHCGS